MNWFNRHLSWTALLAIVAFLTIALSVSIWVGEEEGWMFFGAVPAALAGYIFGEYRGKSKIGEKVRKAKEDARSMIESRSSYTPTRETTGQFIIHDGIKYSEVRFWEVLGILEQEAKRHRNEAEEEEKLLSDLHS